MPACTTPLLCPVWWAATRVSLSSTVTGSPGASINNCRATANPTIPAPTTTTLIRHHRVPTRRGLSHSCDAPSLLFALALHRPHRQGCHTSLGTGRPCSCAVFLPETRWVDRVPTLPEQPTEESDLEHYGGRSGGGWSRDCRRPHHGRRTKRRCAVLGRLRGTGRAHPVRPRRHVRPGRYRRPERRAAHPCRRVHGGAVRVRGSRSRRDHPRPERHGGGSDRRRRADPERSGDRPSQGGHLRMDSEPCLCGLVGGAGITRYVQARDAARTAGGGDVHQRVQHGRRRLLPGVLSVSVRLETTASTPQSTSGTPRICSLWSRGSPCETSTVSQPCLRAWASRSLLRSPTMTTDAPSSCADTAAAIPTGPARPT